MPKLRLGHAFVAVLLLVAMLCQGTWALAGTTGGLSGTLTDSTTGKPVADAKISVSSPSQNASTTTDAGGRFNFLNLAPDTYTVSAEKEGYAPATVGGVTIFADQSLTVSLQTQPQLKTIAKITSRAAGNLVKPGTTADVYSVNAATQQVVSGSGGGFNLNSAYSGVYSQPGVTSYVGNYGWGQVFYIRGSAYSQIGYEFDGVPVNRAFDNYQANSLSSLGQQELQVYTGGSPSGASSATLGGFINQVIKTGTYPGFGTLKGGIGAPGFYHGLMAEAGGASPNRNFSYYVGLQGYNQHFPYGTFNNMSGIDYSGQSQYGFTAPAESASLYYALCGGLQCNGQGLPIPFGNYTAVPDNGQYPFFFGNGPWPACQVSNGLPKGQSAPGGTFNGACLGYGPFGNGYLSDMYERDNVINVHFGIPHKNDSGRDDLQLLYDNSMQYQLNASSIVDNGGLGMISGFLSQFAPDASGPFANGPYAGFCGEQNDNSFGCATQTSPIPYADSLIFAPGTAFGQKVSTAQIVPYYFPNSNQNRPLNNPFTGNMQAGLPLALRDGFWNDVGIVKAQYTKNIGTNAYARLFGYTFYSDWMINGPDCASSVYLDGLLNGGLCGNTPNYELATHTRGAEFQFADQLNAQNLLRFTANYTTAGVSRWNNGSFRSGYSGSRKGVTNWTNGDPNNPICYAFRNQASHGIVAGQPADCFSSRAYGTFGTPQENDLATVCGTGGTLAATPGCASYNAGTSNWLVTVPSGQGTYNTVTPKFTSFALEDEFKPNDKLDLNLGVRYENYRYDLTDSNNNEFNFWFNAAAQVFCYDPGTGLPMLTPLTPGQPVPPAPLETNRLASCGVAPSGQEGLHPVGNTSLCNGTTAVDCGPLQYTAVGAGSFQHGMVSPRVGATYTLSPDTVLRFSAGKYTQPTETAFEQYLDQSGKRAANFDFAQFWGLGFHNPTHDNPVQYSNNFDFSVEQHFHNTDITLKASPFYRDTHHEIVTVVLGPGFVGGVNAGHQHSYGVELGIQKGDPSRDGLAGGLSYTYTKALISYDNLANGTNAIDLLNNYVKEFNALTQAGGGAPCYSTTTFLPNGSNAPDPTCAANSIKNPYYNMSQQASLDRNGWYATYPNEAPNDPTDQGGTSAIAPHQFSGWLQWKHNKLAIAPNFQLIAGGYYGSPTDTYGVDPRWCTQNQGAATDTAGNPLAIPAGDAQNPDFLSCGATGNTQSGYLAIPNPYTGRMDSVGQFQQPWIFNMGALIRYDISPKVTANLTLTNLVNTCFGGTNTPWSSRFKPNNYVCGYNQGNGNYIGPTKGQPGFGGGFFYGDAPTDAVNGPGPYAPAYNYPFAPAFGAEPFQAYLELQIKL